MLTQVFESIKINNLVVPNRIVRTAHETLFHRGPIGDELINYHVARAKGGVGLSIMEATSVHYSSVGIGLTNHDDSAIDGFKRLTDAIKPHGMKMFMQLWHGGNGSFGPMGGVPWGVSPVPNPYHGMIPVAMNQEQISEVVTAYATAARRCLEGGFDGVEIHAAHGYLPAQFLSPVMNRREDEYGGSIENRTRFLREVLSAIRKACGKGYPLGVRLSASTAANVLSESDLMQVVRLIEADQLIDFLDVSYGDYYGVAQIAQAMDAPVGYELPSASQITAVSKVPRIVCGRIRTLEEAEQVLREGVADLVGMTRAHIADPELVKKTREGRIDQVRPCISCNQGCLGEFFTFYRMGCTVNAAVGLEGMLDENLIVPSVRPRKVLIIGGGPAGMEAARLAALQGHKVVLAEATKSLGGQVNVAKQAPRLHGLGDITDWLEKEMYRLGIEVRLNTYMDAADVRAEYADTVIVATGSQPRMDGRQAGNPGEVIKGMDLPHVMSPTDLFLDGSRVKGQHAFIYDDVGHYEALAAAEYLIERGKSVTIAIRTHGLSDGIIAGAQRMEPVLERLRSKGDIRLITHSYVIEIAVGSTKVAGIRSTKIESIAADIVVMVLHKSPVQELYDELRGTVSSLHLVGDALAPRDLKAAIHDGHKAGRAVAAA